MQKSKKILAAMATPVAVLAAGAMVYQASYAAYTGKTANEGNAWTTGSINLVDDDKGSAMFTVENMLPGQNATKCIKVTATASVPSTVKGYTINAVKASGLEDRIMIDLESGRGGAFNDCDGFVPDGETVINARPLGWLMDNATDFTKAKGEWKLSGDGVPAHKTYRVKYTFDTTGLSQDAINGLMGKQARVGLQWEMQSDPIPAS